MPNHRALARELVREAHARDGLIPVDVDRFWREQDIAAADPFAAGLPAPAMGLRRMSWECVFAELGEPDDYWRWEQDAAWRRDLTRRYNDRAEKIVGRRLLPEPAADDDGVPPRPTWPDHKKLHDLFEAENVWRDRSWWLMESAHNEAELSALLDRVEKRLENPRAFFLPPAWDAAKPALLAADVPPPRYGWQRGPVTFAMSVFGVENLIYLIHDDEALAGRFRDLILRGMLALGDTLDAEHPSTPAAGGFGFADDNCALLSPGQYEFFGYPILRDVFARFSPAAGDRRFQHSDSAMAHLLPFFGRLGMTGVNFGPTLTVTEIRAHCKRAVIDGQLAPFTFSRNEEENIVREYLRDASAARAERGLNFTTAGSVNDGSRLTGLRLLMAASERFGYGAGEDTP